MEKEHLSKRRINSFFFSVLSVKEYVPLVVDNQLMISEPMQVHPNEHKHVAFLQEKSRRIAEKKFLPLTLPLIRSLRSMEFWTLKDVRSIAVSAENARNSRILVIKRELNFNASVHFAHTIDVESNRNSRDEIHFVEFSLFHHFPCEEQVKRIISFRKIQRLSVEILYVQFVD